MRGVYVIGVGMTKFGRLPNNTIYELGREATWKAIKDAGVNPREIQGGYCGCQMGGKIWGVMTPGENIFWESGLNRIPVVNVENSCATGSSALREAWVSIACGISDLCVVTGVDKTFVQKGAILDPGTSFEIQTAGDSMPGEFALRAARHMFQYGTTIQQLAKISVKNHKYGCWNPYSQYQKECTVEDVLKSPMVADPLTALSCCPNSDGAASVILASRSVAKRYSRRLIQIAASVLRSDPHQNDANYAVYQIDQETVGEAYKMAGLGPDDIDLCECHDAFTIAELMHYEGLGFCPVGEGGHMIDEGAVEIGGRIPFNPSGGLLSNGHPVGASGVRQIVEIAWHLRQEAGQRQVPQAKVGLAHILGGGVGIDPAAETIHILTI
jgi:acetyl-CoA acetyltransferase